MLLSEFLAESIILTEAPAVGREYQHLEDLMIVNGSSGALTALRELKNIESNPKTLNIKWDGRAAVYWGREPNGTFIFAPKAQWEKQSKLTKKGLVKDIQSTGKMKSGQDPAEFAQQRKQLAAEWARVYDELERSCPKNFRGYLWADVMFLHAPKKNKQGNYEFKPNKVDYFISPNSYLGERIIEGAEIMLAVHGKYNEFGQDSSQMVPASDAEVAKFNDLNRRVITLPVQHPMAPIEKNFEIDKLINFVKHNAANIDDIANYTELKFSGLKKILYDYAVKRSHKHGALTFDDYLKTAKISDNQKAILKANVTRRPSWQVFWKIFDLIIDAKHQTLDKLHKSHGAEQHNKLGLSVATQGEPGGEGFAKVTDAGAVKLINPYFRSAEKAALFK